MRRTTVTKDTLGQAAAIAILSICVWQAQAAVPGVKGPSFDLTAATGYITQPDGASVYSWGYGCNTAPAPSSFLPNAGTFTTSSFCAAGRMQLPGPTLIVREGEQVTVTLHNNLPAAAGNTSMLFPGFVVKATGGVAGALTKEAANSSAGGLNTVTYSFKATTPGTHSYYSGTQSDLQIEMGLYGALVVLPSSAPSNCNSTQNDKARTAHSGQTDFRLANAAYDNAATCYDREYLFQFSELDPLIHAQVEQQKDVPCTDPHGCMVVQTEPYKAAYFMINGRSMPDDMDPNYSTQYPLQPYNGNPHLHPGELTLLRIIGQGRMQHPFHEHANHVRVLARDGNLQLTPNGNLAGPLLFTTTTTPGQTIDAIFEWTGKNLNWDVYAHADGKTTDTCTPDALGYNTGDAATGASNYYEWCADHTKPLESKPFGEIGGGGPVTLPDPNILANGNWYSGSPYLGPDATLRAVGLTPIPPFGTIANDPGSEAGFAFMWHSHNEREITTSNIFPGGMMMMMLVDPWVFSIDESN